MSKTIVLCEKQNQAKEVRAIIGNRYGMVMGASGHVLRLLEPNEVKPEWDVSWTLWKAEAMLPDAGMYGYAKSKDPRSAKLYDEIERALKGADTVIVATDPDREGQSIGDEILKFAGFRGKALRVIYNNTDRITIEQAFKNLKDNREFRSQYYAAFARQNIDQIFGMSMTRLVSRELARLGWAGRTVRGKRQRKVGIGRVRTPIWGMICSRELAIADFTPRDYFEIGLDAKTDLGTVRLWHRPKEDDRLFERAAAETLCSKVAGWRGPLSVQKADKQQAGPKPPDLPTLQKRASAMWKWKASKTLEVLQALYDSPIGIATYPRAETRYLPEVMVNDVPAILAGLSALPRFAGYAAPEPVIRSGKKGVFCDAALEKLSHHAVIPNVAKADEFAKIYPNLTADQQKLFDLICGYYAAMVAPPFLYQQTVISAKVDTMEFRTSGRVVRSLGWREVYAKGGDDPTEADNKDEVDGLPPIPDGTMATEAGHELVKKTTSPPARFTDGGIVDAMQNVWKLVDDPDLRAKLKETNGLGTPATRDSFIEALEQDGLIQTTKKGLVVPTDDGLTLYRALVGVCPDLFDPAATATLELQLDDVLYERADLKSVIAAGAAMTDRLIATVIAWTSKSPPLFKNPPSPAMLKRALAVAQEKGIALPADAQEHFSVCRAFLDEHVGEGGDGPSEKQVEYARKLAETTGSALTEELLGDRQKLSEWIDRQKKVALKTEPATERQIEYLQGVINAGYVQAPEGWPAISKAQASQMIDSHKGTGRNGSGKGGSGRSARGSGGTARRSGASSGARRSASR